MAKKPQIEKFREKAREIGASDDAEKFDSTLRRMAGKKPDPKAIDEMADMLGMADSKKDFGRKRRKD